jgi:RND family efflux transporter MFP subunit
VEVATLEPRALEESSDYLATLSSRRAVTLYPRVSGYVRKIAARPGERVRASAPLLLVDPSTEEASLDTLVANRASLTAAASYARDRLARLKTLRSDGIVSQQDLDQAHSDAEQAAASLRAADAQIAAQRARLGQFQILAPFPGVLGDVPVKEGDFVTPTTVLGSVTEDASLDAYVSVPIERASQLTQQSSIRLLSSAGEPIAQSVVSFVSPRADLATQLLLLKAAFAPNARLRPDQVVRARVVWSAHTGLALPTSAVFRQAGQYFAYVVDDERTPVVRMVPVSLGTLHAQGYGVERGLAPGQSVVVSGLRQLSDGMRVELKPRAQAEN